VVEVTPTILRGEQPPATGDGYGYGSGSGSGYGYGSGSGDGSGYGDGYGYGYGYGSGYGDGYGYGYGSGSGYGYGDGDGSKEYWMSTIPYFAQKWASAQSGRLQELQQAGATIAFWRSDKDGRACNGGRSAEPVQAGKVEMIKGPLRICTSQALHATFVPPKWKGERVWIVALTGEIKTQEDKVGALTREIIGEAL
jgi:hypothetical protein